MPKPYSGWCGSQVDAHLHLQGQRRGHSGTAGSRGGQQQQANGDGGGGNAGTRPPQQRRRRPRGPGGGSAAGDGGNGAFASNGGGPVAGGGGLSAGLAARLGPGNASSDSLQHVAKHPRISSTASAGPQAARFSSTTAEHLTGTQFHSLGLAPNTQR
jgi:hypothetical protein